MFGGDLVDKLGDLAQDVDAPRTLNCLLFGLLRDLSGVKLSYFNYALFWTEILGSRPLLHNQPLGLRLAQAGLIVGRGGRLATALGLRTLSSLHFIGLLTDGGTHVLGRFVPSVRL